MRHYVIVAALIFSAQLSAAKSPAPIDVTISPANFANAADYSRRHGGLAVRVEVGGKLVGEDYAGGYSASTSHKIYSGTKSFVAIGVLIAAQEGLLTFDEKACQTLPEWRNDRRRAITIHELLSHTSGLDPDLDRLYPYADQLAAAVRVPLIDTPGVRFHYGGVNYQALGEILRRKLQARHESLEHFLTSRVFDPLDIDIDTWTHDRAGNPLTHSGISLTPAEWAKFGAFVNAARRGEPHRVLPNSTLAPLFIGTAANPAYGQGFWLNRPPPGTQPIRIIQLAIDGDQLYPGGPRDLCAALGSGHQMLYMIPSLNLVVVRFGDGSRYSDGDFLSRLLTGKPHPDAHSH